MADRVVLHVGTMKSGTTSLQAMLFANRQTLAGAGLLVPGETWGDQARAVTEVARTRHTDGERWSRLTSEIADWPGSAVVSMEYLGPFDPRQVAAVADSLGAPRVEVVVTVRDLNRSLVSMWQETVQNGRWWSWADYLAAARRCRPRRRMPREISEAGRTFWRQQDVVGMVRRWRDVVGSEAVTVVTVPPPGADPRELTGRFARAVGFAADECAPGEASANASLGVVSAVLLQRVNAVLAAEGMALGEGKRFRKRVVAKGIFGARAAAEPKIGLPVARWVRSYAAGTVRRLDAVVRLEGAWPDLVPVEVAGLDPATIEVASVTAAAAEAYGDLRDHLVAEGLTGLPTWPVKADGDKAIAALAGLVAAGVRAGATG